MTRTPARPRRSRIISTTTDRNLDRVRDTSLLAVTVAHAALVLRSLRRGHPGTVPLALALRKMKLGATTSVAH